MRFYLIYANRRRDQDPDAGIRQGAIATDMTDWENRHFRYTL
jgi:hypothetical protein